MATNPMQRKSRMSFILGMLLMLVIMGLVVAFLVFQLMDKNKQIQKQQASKANVYVLTQDVSEGQIITTDMMSKIQVDSATIPSNATSNIDTFENYSLTDKEGNQIKTKNQNNEIILYINKNGKDTQVQTEDATETVDGLNVNSYQYYTENGSNKEYIELSSDPLKAKVTMKANTVMTTELVNRDATKDVRKQEYNMVVLPTDLETGNYVDIRLMLPSGQDYIVVSKKEVTIPDLSGTLSPDTIWMNLREDEILSMSSAIVEAYTISGAKLYATKYVDASTQEAAIPTYWPNSSVTSQINSDPNIVSKAMTELRTRYNAGSELRNNSITPAINNAGADGTTNVQSGMEKSITSTQTTRKSYLDSL